MKLIVITTEHFFEGEAAALNALFERGMEILHLRKPASTENELKNLTGQIDERFHERIVLHDHYPLINTFRLKGIHLNSRNTGQSARVSCSVSRSCHSFRELENATGYDYVFLSPVFDSISKTGYTRAFTQDDLFNAQSTGLINKQVIALGGINAENIPSLYKYGFGGVAVIGAMWGNFPNDKDENALFERFDQLQTASKKAGLQDGGLLFITHQTEHYTYLQSVEIALKGGCRMIQLRMKDALPQEVEQTGILAKALCQAFGADLYIDDHVEICRRIGATGVHLGKTDMPPREARKILGENFIIGGTANTFEDIQRLQAEGVDYIGLGPFRFTTTKKNLSPVIGLSGYKKIAEQCVSQEINLPIFAIGGIMANDIPEILRTGINGIALSSTILQAENPLEEMKKVIEIPKIEIIQNKSKRKKTNFSMERKNEIIIYQPDNTIQLEVWLENETVWLNRQQMSVLFDRDIKTIGKHINNALKEELAEFSTGANFAPVENQQKNSTVAKFAPVENPQTNSTVANFAPVENSQTNSVVAKFATTASNGKVYQLEHYSLDVILSVGYRVKSNRGIQFRAWANKVLKDYFLKGYAINQRFERIEHRVAETEKKIDFFVKTALPPVEGVFHDGQIFDAYIFAANLIKSARKSIVLIDNYIDESVLLLLSKRAANISAEIFTQKISAQLQLDITKHNAQYPPIKTSIRKHCHDRFLIIDSTVYHIGASLKDLGRKLFAFAKMKTSKKELLKNLT